MHSDDAPFTIGYMFSKSTSSHLTPRRAKVLEDWNLVDPALEPDKYAEMIRQIELRKEKIRVNALSTLDLIGEIAEDLGKDGS